MRSFPSDSGGFVIYFNSFPMISSDSNRVFRMTKRFTGTSDLHIIPSDFIDSDYSDLIQLIPKTNV